MTESHIDCERMYELLTTIDKRVALSLAAHDSYTKQLLDHEQRLRTIEMHADLVRRVDDLERSTVEMQRRVWAIPSASVLIAAAALIATFWLNHQ